MKLLLLVVAIHLLIFHQHHKDKNESLAPQMSKSFKATGQFSNPFFVQDIEINTNDSLQFSDQPESFQYSGFPTYTFSPAWANNSIADR